MKSSYNPFIDWLKCLGMTVIVYGHVAAWGPLATLPPIYSKQLGVAFFVFVTGYSLAAETRSRWRVVFNRLFEMYLFGLAVAVVVSLASGRLQPSNYLPFLGGVNVFRDAFPANPTSWYLGTYLHFVVLWALFVYRVRVGPRLLTMSLVGEIGVRAAIMQTAGLFPAYMLLPNWSTVFLLGSWYGQRKEHRTCLSASNATAAILVLVVSLGSWSALAPHLPFEAAIPFMRWRTGDTIGGALIVSAAISILYLGATWLVFSIVGPFPAPRLVRFIARNTLIIFLAHMPVYYALVPPLIRAGISRDLRAPILMIVCLPGLALVSEGVRRWLRPRELRERIYERVRVRATRSPVLAAVQ